MLGYAWALLHFVGRASTPSATSECQCSGILFITYSKSLTMKTRIVLFILFAILNCSCKENLTKNSQPTEIPANHQSSLQVTFWMEEQPHIISNFDSCYYVTEYSDNGVKHNLHIVYYSPFRETVITTEHQVDTLLADSIHHGKLTH
ncbi:MAG: hypothetical protein K0Q79_3025 [Flavipsychrobacter sp.]|jgi:hypothetical protein|nr:hypothetical protein [Flavipsychrobacter sp.]